MASVTGQVPSDLSVTNASVQNVLTAGTLSARVAHIVDAHIADAQILTLSVAEVNVGRITVDDLVVTGDLMVDGNEIVLGDLTVYGNETIQGNLTVEGNETVQGNLTVEGNETIQGNLTVEGNETIQGNLTVEGNETVQGNLTVDGTLSTNTFELPTGAATNDVLTCVNGSGLAAWRPVFGNITVTVGGTPLYPLFLGNLYPETPITSSGTYTTTSSSTAMTGLTYNEQGYTPGGLQTLTVSGVTQVVGSLSLFDCIALTSVSFPHLVGIFPPAFGVVTSTVSGLILNGLYSLTSVNLPLLQQITGGLSMIASTLTTLSLPALVNCTGNIGLNVNSLTTLALPNVQFIGGLNVFATSFDTLNSPLTTLTLTNLRACNGSINFNAFSYNQLTTMAFPALVVVGNFQVQSTVAASPWPLLTTISLPSLQTVYNTFQLAGTLAALTTLNVSACTTIGVITITATMPLLTSLSFPALTNVRNFAAHNESLSSNASNGPGVFTVTPGAGPTSISFPLLATVDRSVAVGGGAGMLTINFASLASVGFLSSGGFTLNQTNSLTTLTLTSLAQVNGALLLNIGNGLIAVSLPALATVNGAVTVQNGTSATSVTMPVLVTVGGAINVTTSLGNVVTVTLGSLGTTYSAGQYGTLRSVSGNVSYAGQKLDQASVDTILVNLASLDGGGGTTSYGAGRTVTLTGGTNSTPSAQGLAAKAALVGRGATVTNN